jgi:hypothetical protein
LNLARPCYGWQKRAKEMARKEKNDEKIKRRPSAGKNSNLTGRGKAAGG